MTKTEAKRLARHARRHGYFDTGRVVWVVCPLCGEKAESDKITGRTATQLLDAAVLFHLDGYCEEAANR